jgi:AraC-like DNA-binding protein
MIYRIFDQSLAGHTWSEEGRLQVVQVVPYASHRQTSPECARTSLFARLVIRSKRDRVMCRAARRLTESPATQLDQLASELGVSERYLVAGLRAVLGVSPELLAVTPEVRRAA